MSEPQAAVPAQAERLTNAQLGDRLAADPGVTLSRGRSPVRAVVYQAAGWLIVVTAVVGWLLLLTLAKRGGGASGMLGVIPIIVLAVVSSIGASLIVRGQRLWPADARRLLRTDPRPPVVYLRSFRDDRDTGVQSPTQLGQFSVAIPNPTEEQDLARVLGAVGPVLAIGNPTERLPVLGAARIYVANDRWQDVVHQLIAAARMIVLRSGQTPGLAWEVARVARKVPPDRVLLYGSGSYDAFRANAAGAVPHGLPETIGASRFIAFGADWQPRVIKRRAGGFDLQVAGKAATLRKELADVLRQAGAPPGSAFGKLARAVGLLLFLVAFFAAVVWFAAHFGG